MERAFFLLLLAGAAFAGDRTYPANDLSPLNMPPILDNGYLIVRGLGHEFEVYRPDGAPAYSIGKLAECRMIINAAVDRDGTAAVGVEMEDRSGRIVLFNRDGTQLIAFDTREFVPSYLAFGADQSIWAASKGQLRHFSREGKALGVYGSVSADLQWQEPVIQLPALRVSSDRVGYLIHAGSHKDLKWVEFGLDGKELGRWVVPQQSGGWPPVFMGGRTYVWTDPGLLMLDRTAGQWTPISVLTGGVLVGSDKDALVFADRHGNTLHWVRLNEH